jgi:hypothetical protein
MMGSEKGFIKLMIVFFIFLLGIGFFISTCKGNKNIPKRDGTIERSRSNDLEKLAEDYVSLRKELEKAGNDCEPAPGKTYASEKCKPFRISDIERELQDISLKLRAYKYEDVQRMFSRLEKKQQ